MQEAPENEDGPVATHGAGPVRIFPSHLSPDATDTFHRRASGPEDAADLSPWCPPDAEGLTPHERRLFKKDPALAYDPFWARLIFGEGEVPPWYFTIALAHAQWYHGISPSDLAALYLRQMGAPPMSSQKSPWPQQHRPPSEQAALVRLLLASANFTLVDLCKGREDGGGDDDRQAVAAEPAEMYQLHAKGEQIDLDEYARRIGRWAAVVGERSSVADRVIEVFCYESDPARKRPLRTDASWSTDNTGRRLLLALEAAGFLVRSVEELEELGAA